MAMNNRGSVLVFVLIFIAFAASTVLLMHEKSMESFGSASEDFYENQSHIYAMTSVEAVKQTIADDDNKYDSAREIWAMIPMMEVPYGFVSISVKPLSGKLSINNLIDSDQKIAKRHMESCVRIFEDFNIDEITCGELKDYIDADSENSVDGEEDKVYERNGITFRTKNRPLETLMELKLLIDNPEKFNLIKDMVTVYSPEKSLNLNFANKETLDYMLPELDGQAEEIISYRRDKDFKDVSNIHDTISISQEDYVKILPFISVKSSLFYVKSEVTLNGKSRYYHALIKKEGGRTDIVKFMAGLNGDYY